MSKTENLTPLNWAEMEFGIEGISPLITHAWSEKGLDMLRMTAAERRKQPKVARDPEGEAEASAYKTPEGEYGIPMLAFKAALIGAAHKDLGLEKTLVRKCIWLPGGSDNVWPISFESARIREDIVRVGANQTDLRYRMEFTGWKCVVKLNILRTDMTPRDLALLTQRAGMTVGLCEWRPEKGGDFGRFDLVREAMRVTEIETYIPEVVNG